MIESQMVGPPRLGDRLAALRDKYFAGRTAELDVFRSALHHDAVDRPVALLFVHGPGGVGKTVLLRQFGRLAAAAGATVIGLDGRDLEPSPAGFLSAVRAALGLHERAHPLEVLASHQRPVLLIDTYEALTALGLLGTWNS
jgi:ATP/maltotriose-dependent transcriptional regulator MalT